jgi:hypothetical protein
MIALIVRFYKHRRHAWSRSFLHLVSRATITFWILSLVLAPQEVQGLTAGYTEYYIPGGSDQLWEIFTNLDNDPPLVDFVPTPGPTDRWGLHSVIAATASADNTVIYYDHWEDGYDVNPLTPGPTSETYTLNKGNVQD